MPQYLRNIPLQLRDGPAQEAVAVGNNAAWLCPCGRRLPLLGRTHGSPGEAPANFRVACPDCKREYIIDPADDAPQGRAVQVREISSKSGYDSKSES